MLAPFLHTRFLFPCPLRTPRRGPSLSSSPGSQGENKDLFQHALVPFRPLRASGKWYLCGQGQQPATWVLLTSDLCPLASQLAGGTWDNLQSWCAFFVFVLFSSVFLLNV